jgi:glycosyltransferase involved in cell wall biosynthesis
VGGAGLEPDVRLAYLTAEYPKVSHTFVMREVAALRRLGAAVETFSIRRTPEEGLLSDADRAAALETFAVLPPDWPRLAGAHVRSALRHPRRYAATLRLALALSPPGLRARLWQLFYFAEAVLVADELGRRHVDHVHAHFVNVACWVALLAAELRGLTWSFTMHGPLELDEVERHRIAEKVRRADLVVCISDFARAQLMRQVEPSCWDKLHVVHCGVEPLLYAPNGDGPRPAGGPLQVVSVGRLAAMKGFPVLIDALAALGRDGPPVRLTLVGDGPDADALRAQAQRAGVSVEFAGALSADEVARVVRRADVFCLPSFAEGVPVVLMEAMAAGLPVVSTAVMGIPELVADGVSGILVPPGRSDALAGALRTLAEDPLVRRSLGEAGRSTVLRAFDVDESARTLLELFSQTTIPEVTHS